MLKYQEIFSFIFITFFTLLIWCLFFGWNPNLFISNEDSSHLLNLYRFYLESASDSLDISFQPYLQGGVSLWESVGFNWLVFLAKLLGCGAFSFFNFNIILIQVLISFLVLNLIVRHLINDKKLSQGHLGLLSFFVVVLFSFYPSVLNRIIFGHILFLYGLVSFLVCTNLLFDFYKKEINSKLLIFYFLILTITLPSNGQQLFIYGFYSMLPFLILFKKRVYCSLIPVAGVVVSALLFTWSSFYPLVEKALTMRTISSNITDKESFIYSYGWLNLDMILNNLSINVENLIDHYHFYIIHEIDYGISGLFILMIFFLYKIRTKEYFSKILLSIFILTLFLFEFSMKLFPLSSILSYLPGGSLFRVPARFLIIYNLFTGVAGILFFSRYLLDNFDNRKILILLISLFFIIAIFFKFNEHIYYLSIILMFLSLLIKKRSDLFLSIGSSLFLISILSLSEARMLKFFDIKNYEKKLSEFKEIEKNNKYFERSIVKSSALNKTIYMNGQDIGSLFTDKSINGSQHFNLEFARFMQTYFDIIGLKGRDMFTESHFVIDNSSKYFETFKKLFSIKYIYEREYTQKSLDSGIKNIQDYLSSKSIVKKVNSTYFYRDDNKLDYLSTGRFDEFVEGYKKYKITELKDVKSFWFPTSVKYFEKINENIEYVLKNPGEIYNEAMISGEKKILLNESCKNSRINNFEFKANKVQLSGSSPDNCIIALPLVNNKNLALNSQNQINKITLYGVILGIEVPKGSWNFSIEYRNNISKKLDYILKLISILLLILIIQLFCKNRDQKNE